MQTYLWDKIIDVTLLTSMDLLAPVATNGIVIHQGEDEWIPYYVVGCPAKGGLKPQITYTCSMLPGGVTVNVELRFQNMVLEMDIDRVVGADVYIGYAQNTAARLYQRISILSTYVESPNPNGSTVIKGVVGEWYGSAIRSQAVRFVSQSETITAGQLLYDVAKGLGCNLRLDFDTESAKWETEIRLGKKEYLANNGAVALQMFIETINKELWRNDVSNQLRYIIRSNDVLIYQQGYVPSDKLDTELVVVLNRLTSVTFQGGTIKVIAPFDPRMQPGGLIFLWSAFFRGRARPGMINTATKAKDNIYRVITMDIAFDTCGNTNRMELMCIATNLHLDNTTLGRPPGTVYNEQSENEVIGQPYTVPLGIKDAIEANDALTSELNKANPKPLTTVTDQKDQKDLDTLLNQFKSLANRLISGAKVYLIVPSDTLSQIAEREINWGPLKGSIKVGTAAQGPLYLKYMAAYKEAFGAPVPASFSWPVISLATWCVSALAQAGDPTWSTYAINGRTVWSNIQRAWTDPDNILRGKYLIIPSSISDWETALTFQGIDEFYLEMAAWYKEEHVLPSGAVMKAKPSYASSLLKIGRAAELAQK